MARDGTSNNLAQKNDPDQTLQQKHGGGNMSCRLLAQTMGQMAWRWRITKAYGGGGVYRVGKA
jgi:hypothetical protein